MKLQYNAARHLALLRSAMHGSQGRGSHTIATTKYNGLLIPNDITLDRHIKQTAGAVTSHPLHRSCTPGTEQYFAHLAQLIKQQLHSTSVEATRVVKEALWAEVRTGGSTPKQLHQGVSSSCEQGLMQLLEVCTDMWQLLVGPDHPLLQPLLHQRWAPIAVALRSVAQALVLHVADQQLQQQQQQQQQ